MPTLEPTDYVSTMAQVPTPVTIVTTLDADGRPWGFTAGSFTSLSLDPPLVLVCPAKTASCHQAFTTGDRFLINVLATQHTDIATHFARSGHDKFTNSGMQPSELGLPGLPDATARIACTLHTVLDGGDHSILIGHVEAVSHTHDTPLVYHNRNYTQPAHTKTLATTPS
ncbi:flavin reductase family protein [Streptomyces sp. NPDC001568]|uniref:flavin reductase family protein n=1 Tax=Streptomyces sp. NPDC001568 TaxID=3364588 RepID=UPI0036B214DC